MWEQHWVAISSAAMQRRLLLLLLLLLPQVLGGTLRAAA
jgi:hypothetical protein